MRRGVAPQIDFRCSRWPPQRQIAAELDRVQQKMAASLIRPAWRPGEEAPEYVRRRGRAARKWCKDNGQWSARWFQRALKWNEHLTRAHDPNNWGAQLLKYHGREWLMWRRAMFAPTSASRASPASILAGRTDTRAFRGKVCTRFHDGIEFARSYDSKLRTPAVYIFLMRAGSTSLAHIVSAMASSSV